MYHSNKEKRAGYNVPLSDAVNFLVADELKKRGISSFSLLWQWDKIIGKDLAENTLFSKITVRKNGDRILFVTVRSDAAALELSYSKQKIIERINTFGFGKIKDIKFTVDSEMDVYLSASFSEDNLSYINHLKNLDDKAKKDFNMKESLNDGEQLEKALSDLQLYVNEVSKDG